MNTLMDKGKVLHRHAHLYVVGVVYVAGYVEVMLAAGRQAANQVSFREHVLV